MLERRRWPFWCVFFAHAAALAGCFGGPQGGGQSGDDGLGYGDGDRATAEAAGLAPGCTGALPDAGAGEVRDAGAERRGRCYAVDGGWSCRCDAEAEEPSLSDAGQCDEALLDLCGLVAVDEPVGDTEEEELAPPEGAPPPCAGEDVPGVCLER